MRNHRLLTWGLLFLLILSCGQEPSKLDHNLINTGDILPYSVTCNKVNLHQDVLLYENANSLFECLGWDKEYPAIYKTIKKLGKEKYNFVIDPINNSFFKKEKDRTAFIDFFQTNLTEESAKEISKVTSLIIEKHQTLETVLSVFKASNNLKTNITLLPNDKFFSELLKMLNSISNKTESERIDFAKFFKTQSLKQKDGKIKKQLVEIVNSVVSDIFKTGGEVAINISNAIGDGGWPVVLFNQISKAEFSNLVYYPLVDDSISDKMLYLKDSFENNRNDCSENERIYVLDHSVELKKRMNDIRELSRIDFSNSVVDLELRFSLFNSICPNSNFYNTTSTMLNHLGTYLNLNGGFPLLQNIANSSVQKDDPYTIFNFIGSDFFKRFVTFTELDSKEYHLIEEAYGILSNLSYENFKNISAFMKSVSDDKEMNKSWSIIWTQLKKEEQEILIEFYFDLFLFTDKINSTLNVLDLFNGQFPKVLGGYRELITNNMYESEVIVDFLEENLKNEILRDELKSFLSEKTLLKLLSILINERTPLKTEENKPLILSTEEQNGYERDYITEKIEIICLKDFHKRVMSGHQFWDILASYPESCKEVENKSIAYKIFEWTFEIDTVFMAKTQSRFSKPYGIISSEMMSFYHSIIHIINNNLDKEEGYIDDVIQKIKKHLYEYKLEEVVADSIILLNDINQKTSILDPILTKAMEVEDKEFDQNIKNILFILSRNNPASKFHYQAKINSPVGGKKSWSDLDILEFSERLIALTNNSKLIEKLADFISPEKKVLYPISRKRQNEYEFKLQPLVELLFYMGSTKTEEEISYSRLNSKVNVSANLAERLEVVLREISFLNNFYGAYFINKVAKAKNYVRNIKSMKKNIKLFEKTSGFFRKRGLFPEETKWAFSNIYSSYDSLWQLGLDSHAPLVQSIMGVLVESSSIESQDFSPFQTPKPNLVENHLGKILTLFAEYSVFSHLSSWTQQNFKKEELNIGSNILNSLSKDNIEKILISILSHKNSKALVSDIISLLIRDQSHLVETFKSFYKILEVHQIDLNKFVDLIPVLLDHYLEIRNELIGGTVQAALSDVGQNILKLKEIEQSGVLKIIITILDMLSKDDLDEVLNKDGVKKINKLLKSIEYYSQFRADGNFMQKFLKDKNLSFVPIKTLLIEVFNKENNFNYINNTLMVLSEHNAQGEANITLAHKELFKKNETVILKFLADLFTQFSISK